MIRKLAWRAPSAVSFRPNATAGDPEYAPDKVRVLKDGSCVPIPEPKAYVGEGMTILEAHQEDVADVHAALAWFCGQDVPMPAMVGKANGLVQLRFKGDFTASPSPDDLKQIVADFRLLSGTFASWAQVVKPASREVEALESIVFTLVEGKADMTNSNELSWAIRALEARIQNRR